MERMGGEDTADMNRTADRLKEGKAKHPAPAAPAPEQEELRLHGLRILARMIIKAYLQNPLQGTDADSRAADEPTGATTPPTPEHPGQQ